MWLDLHTSLLLDKWLDSTEPRLRRPTNHLTISNHLFYIPEIMHLRELILSKVVACSNCFNLGFACP